MDKQRVWKGPTGARVAANVRQLRKARGMNLAALAERMFELGQPIGLSGLSKLENGDRRVDVDDLAALAVALGVTPNRLLLTADAGEIEVELTAGVAATGGAAWRWAAGDDPLPGDSLQPLDLDRLSRFQRENRPHDPPDDTPASELERHEDVLAPVAVAVRAARGRGLSLQSVLSYVRLMETLRQFTQAVVPESMRRIARQERARRAEEGNN